MNVAGHGAEVEEHPLCLDLLTETCRRKEAAEIETVSFFVTECEALVVLRRRSGCGERERRWNEKKKITAKVEVPKLWIVIRRSEYSRLLKLVYSFSRFTLEFRIKSTPEITDRTHGVLGLISSTVSSSLAICDIDRSPSILNARNASFFRRKARCKN